MEDTIKLPLDEDGVPIRLGDIVYEIGTEEKLRVRFLKVTDAGWLVCCYGEELYGNEDYWRPEELTHISPDSLEDIEKTIRRLATSEHQENPEEDVKKLMERIKRMVER